MRTRAAIALLVSGMLAVSASALDAIRVTGSDLLGAEFMRALEQFGRQNDFVMKLDLRGTRPGLLELKERRADIGLFMLPTGELPPADGLISKAIAYQVAVVVVPNASPLKQITLPQLRGIFALSAGDAFARWGELNLTGEWTSRPIGLRAVAAKASLAFPIFQRAILNGGEAKTGLEFLASVDAFNKRLLATENAIGVAGFTCAENTGVRTLAIATGPNDPSYAPTAENVHAGRYMLRLPLYVTFRRETAQELQVFLKFLLSEEAIAALASENFIGLPLGARNQLVFELEEIR